MNDNPKLGDNKMGQYIGVHNNDPMSSFEAFDKTEKSGRRQCNRDFVFNLVCKFPNSTAGELFSFQKKLHLQEIRRRLTDLAATNQISRGSQRICCEVGTKCVTWNRLLQEK